MPLNRNAPKLTISDCAVILRELPLLGPSGAAQLARRYGVSKTTIYQVRDGEYSAQKTARLMGIKMPGTENVTDESLCPGCGLPTGRPCLVCRTNRDIDEKNPQPA